MIYQQTLDRELVKKIRVTSVQSVPPRFGIKLEEFDEDEETESWLFRELVSGLMWLAISTHSDISNVVPSAARYCSAPKVIHWKAALGILEYIKGISGFGIVSQRGTSVGISLEFSADADYASKATDMCKVEKICVEVHLFVDFPGRKNVPPSLRLEQSMLLLATQ